MSTTLELATGELVTLAAGVELPGGGRMTLLQVYGRRITPRLAGDPSKAYLPVDALVQLRPEEVARLVVELLQRLTVANLPASVRMALENDLRRLGFAE